MDAAEAKIYRLFPTRLCPNYILQANYKQSAAVS